ncbi:MAG: putative oxidoreductase [Gammaproteobacteria bacterium]|jgi:putative oxidoreductase|nr:putative oxidoreductase [Gammaproteobacteria bacterium]
MLALDKFYAPNTLAARLLDPLQPLLALAIRLYVSWQFLKSGYIKITSWDTTIYLFENEYHTPVLSPHVAAVTGAFGELFFPTLLVLGFYSRLSAIGLFAVNATAVISYSQVLLAEGSEAALGQHILWGSLLLVAIVYGPGRLSVDYLVGRQRI